MLHPTLQYLGALLKYDVGEIVCLFFMAGFLPAIFLYQEFYPGRSYFTSITKPSFPLIVIFIFLSFEIGMIFFLNDMLSSPSVIIYPLLFAGRKFRSSVSSLSIFSPLIPLLVYLL